MKKRILSMLLAAILTAASLPLSVGAFYVDMVRSFSGNDQVQLYVEQEDGTYEWVDVFDANGNQLYMEVGKDEWEKLERPMTAEEVARKKAEEEAAAKAAQAQKKAWLEQTYRIKITDICAEKYDMSQIEADIKIIPEALWKKVDAQLSKMGKTLRIDMMDMSHGRGDYAGFYVSGQVEIELAPYLIQVVIPHEYGHHIFMTVLPSLYNSATLKTEWNAITGGEGPQYVTDYAATGYNEDLAETFEWLVYAPDRAKELAYQYPDCVAVKKMDYMRQLLCKVFGLEESIFPDTKPSYPSDWAKASIEEYQSTLNGCTGGVVPYIGNIHPTSYQAPATRMQFAYSMYEDVVRCLYSGKYFGDMGYQEYEDTWKCYIKKEQGRYPIPFVDLDELDIKYSMVCAAYSMNKHGIINGTTPTTFSPYGQITRQEAATMLCRLCKALDYDLPAGELTFEDAADVAPWTQEAVAAVSAAGIMGDVGGNRFDPNGVFSCEQSGITLLRTYKLLMQTVQP